MTVAALASDYHTNPAKGSGITGRIDRLGSFLKKNVRESIDVTYF